MANGLKIFSMSERKERNSNWSSNVIAVKGMSSELWNTTSFMILHPKDAEESLKMPQHQIVHDPDWKV